MKIITCYKCVPDEQDIAVNNADGSLDFSKADAENKPIRSQRY